MLTNLYVKNLALIDEVEVSFSQGLNILTGETGAGKSILLGAINLALGAKFDKDMLRQGEEQALVELTFSGKMSERLEEILKREEIPIEEDILISRRMWAGKSVYRMNGEVVVARVVKEVAEELIDIHGQHEHQSLLKKTKHLEILDEYAAEESKLLLNEVKNVYQQHRDLKKELAELSMDESSKKREQDLLAYEVEEIENARLMPGEDEELESLFRKMNNHQKLSNAMGEIQSLLEEEEGGAASLVSRAVRGMRGLSAYDPGLEGIESQLLDLDSILSDVTKEVTDYLDNLEWDEAEFVRVQDRLNEINRLKDKYGRDTESILQQLEEKQKRLEDLNRIDERRSELEEKVRLCEEKMMSKARKLSGIRKRASEGLCRVLTEALKNLNFLSVSFEISFRELEECTSNGLDEVEFMISTNPGEPVRGLEQVASGGELSRIMLAIKTVLAQKDRIDTLIFDEIDAGISGKTAWKVSEALQGVACCHQVICITHLPQIAAMADAHFEIKKEIVEDHTVTGIHYLNKDQSMAELGRLLGMDGANETALLNAKEMKKQAELVKKKVSVEFSGSE